MSIMTAPAQWLNELAKGTIKTKWGQMMAAKNPSDEEDKPYYRLEPKYGHDVAFAFVTIAPLVAERLAIAEYKMKNPRITPAAPEVNSYQEALELILIDKPGLTADELDQILHLLKTDETMQPIE